MPGESSAAARSWITEPVSNEDKTTAKSESVILLVQRQGEVSEDASGESSKTKGLVRRHHSNLWLCDSEGDLVAESHPSEENADKADPALLIVGEASTEETKTTVITKHQSQTRIDVEVTGDDASTAQKENEEEQQKVNSYLQKSKKHIRHRKRPQPVLGKDLFVSYCRRNKKLRRR
mmetsp:Transcript_14151/g.23589  ORF Transcript_14151/g.23589 Transcript_14151/m.23589 type:complete len:177 (-) Transcript_14151:222-752(-)